MSTLHPTLPPVWVEAQPLGRVLAGAETAGLLAVPAPLAQTLVSDVTGDSRRITPGALFAALASDGDGADGHDYVDAALRAGAVAALVSEAYAAREASALRPARAALVPTASPRAAVAEAAAALYGRPGDALALVGITGTNGKTTTAFLVHGLLTTLGHTAGLVGTVENRIGAARYATAYTTPEAPELQRLLRAMSDGGVTHVAMEVSSHGLALDRVRTLGFDVAVFTNLTQDHLDFHETAEAYAAAKKSLFDGLAPGTVAVVNADDPAWREMTRDTAARVVTVGTQAGADVPVEVVENALAGLLLRIDGHEKRFRMAGRFNALNLASAYAVGRALGFDADETLDALAAAPGVPGRFETVRGGTGDVLGIVDYAHTPDALDNVLATAREIVPAGNALWVVFGCGGDRDRSKRPVMARAAEAGADRVIVTSDNPRTEDPAAILADVVAGLARPAAALVIPDRAEAIRTAAREARPGDVVVVAGKGHETYQIVGATRHAFDDRLVLADAFAARAASTGAPAAHDPR
ncbi:MAG TPA: UDP-N-acetylmuramoyl-L-alanyl-D-glutamate--2,6-diaminopimelate ligase, partial [Rubricoccaceae bacterium]|jgi:UDP-N-acetylmuramoyl-L-alanyl-D-glutamate--2,6-diaminopimelate ligase